MASIEAVPAPKPKHRSCDECRTRKLACSKDPNGCERCRKENINCHYSEQKPMGRPRKRQFIEADKEPLQYYKRRRALLHKSIRIGTSARDHSPWTRLKLADGRTIWHFGDREIIAGPPIDFGDMDLAPVDVGITALSDPLTTVFNSSITDSDKSSTQDIPARCGPCGCLASMYLALSSLQTFPSDVVSALRTVRSAAATAAQSIWCPQCGAVVLENHNPPIESFQNTMLLGTILPIIANGYQRLLRLIDDETDLAIALGETKTFRFHDYGGICGRQEDTESAIVCLEKEIFFNVVEMPPHQWRNTVRAMLRVDIYGHEQGGFKHKGLKDLVAEMEQRQLARHELLEASVRAGSTVERGTYRQNLCFGEQSHGCLEILKMAKVTIDNLTIP